MKSDECVLELIEFARKYQVDDILSICKNESFNADKEVLLNLESLNLSNKKLTSLPEAIGCLKNLQFLNLSKNNLEELPQTLAQLQSLQELDITWNHITKIPEFFSSNLKIKKAWNRHK